MAEGLIGSDPGTLEDRLLVTGKGQFIADVSLPNEAHMCVVRSIYPHARVLSVDMEEARRMPGVLMAFSAQDIRDALSPIPIRVEAREELNAFLQYPLALDRVRYVGEPLAVVLAETRYAAEDAAEAVRVDYDALEPVNDVSQAILPETPRLHESSPDNVAATYSLARGRDAEEVFPECDVVLTERLAVQRHTGIPLETRGLIADYDHAGDRLTVWGATKVPHFNRGVLARMLAMPDDRIRMIETDVGGGFGIRGEFYPEDFLVPYASKLLRRPVKWIEDRQEHFVAANHSRQQEWEVKIGANRDGRVLAVKAELTADMGAYLRTHGTVVPLLAASMLIGPYDIPSYECEVRCVFTNKTPTGTYRAPGRFEANFVRERLLDMLAGELDMDRAEIRLRNLIDPQAVPYEVGIEALGERITYDSGDYPRSLRNVLERLDWSGFPAQKSAAREEGRFIGAGIAPFVEKTGLGPFESTVMRLDGSGKVTLATGLTDLGQKQATTLAQICAGVLGLSLNDFTVVHGDTDAVAYGVGTFASRGAVMGGSSAYLAAQQLREKLIGAAATLLEAPPEGLDLTEGHVFVRDEPARTVSFGEIADREGGELRVEAQFRSDHMTYAHGTHGAVVEVDPQVGTVKVLRYVVDCDIGRIINPANTRGQLVGAAAQGLGGALFEALVYEDGQPRVTSFMDYLLPLATELPAIEAQASENSPSPHNPLGAKGVGECGIAAAGGAIANAVADALSEFGVQPRELPLDPDRLLSLIESAVKVADQRP